MTDTREQIAHAQARAAELFEEISRRKLVRAGETEQSISDAIFALGQREFGTRQHWHRRVVRAGPNTRLPFKATPADRRVGEDDIVSLDLGPVFGEWEADFGRSYVIGASPEKLRLRDDLKTLFVSCLDHYLQHPSLSGAQLYQHVVRSCAERGWGFGGEHAGHLIGAFPMSRDERDAARNRIRPDNEVPMDLPNLDGSTRHWILEIHLLDPSGEFGGFYDRLGT